MLAQLSEEVDYTLTQDAITAAQAVAGALGLSVGAPSNERRLTLGGRRGA